MRKMEPVRRMTQEKQQSNKISANRTLIGLWNQAALDAIAEARLEPTVASRVLHILHAGLYDTWALATDKGKSAYASIGKNDIRKNLDINNALKWNGYKILKELLPDQLYLFERTISKIGEQGRDASGSFGIAVARQVLSERRKDGSLQRWNYRRNFWDRENTENSYLERFDPNLWKPLKVPNGTARDKYENPIITENEATYNWQIPITPHWSKVKPFSLNNSSQFRPVVPPRLGNHNEYLTAKGKETTGDKAYKDQLRQLVRISGSLNEKQKGIAEYWADGPNTTTPVGHWNEIAQDLSRRDGLNIKEDIKLFFILNNALFDTSIAVWDAKYKYQYIRPQEAIRNLYKNEKIKAWNPARKKTTTRKGRHWQPYQESTFITPAFPEYTSGHSAFSYAGALTLSRYFKSDRYYDGASISIYKPRKGKNNNKIGEWKVEWLDYEQRNSNVILRWPTVWKAAADAGRSRLFGGIHIQDSDIRGREMGLSVGKYSWSKSMNLIKQKSIHIDIKDTPETTRYLRQSNNKKEGEIQRNKELHLKEMNARTSYTPRTDKNIMHNTEVLANAKENQSQQRKGEKSTSRSVEVIDFLIKKADNQNITNNLTFEARIGSTKKLKKIILYIESQDGATYELEITKQARKIKNQYELSIDSNQIKNIKGLILKNGDYIFRLVAEDVNGGIDSKEIEAIYDNTRPQLQSIENGRTRKNLISTNPQNINILINEPITASIDTGKYLIRGPKQSNKPIITSVDQPLDGKIRINFEEYLNNGTYKLKLGGIYDKAGNALKNKNIKFGINGTTEVVSIFPSMGETNVITNRPIKIEFNQPVNPKTINVKSIILENNGKQIPVSYSISLDKKYVTLFPKQKLASSSKIIVLVKGNKIKGQGNSKIDANGSEEKGSVLQSEFSTISTAQSEGTNVEGYIFDANYTDKRGLDIPLAGVKVSVVGNDQINTVTNKKGKFQLKDLPIPQAYLQFDASKVKNRDEINYGTIVKPIDTSLGRKTGLESNGKAFNIYFSAIADADVVKLNNKKDTQVKIGQKGLKNLDEMIPNISKKEWERLKITIPAQSLKTSEGDNVEEVAIMAFPPNRIPAPIPIGMDPTYVFTVKAEEATVIEGNAQVEFPNVDNLKPGERNAIMTFDHDDGKWKQTGTAVVTADGKSLVTEGDKGVNALGWKFLGPKPPKPFYPPRRRPDDDDDECPPQSPPGNNNNEETTEVKESVHKQRNLITGDGKMSDTLSLNLINPYSDNDSVDPLIPSACSENNEPIDPWDENLNFELRINIDPVLWEFMEVSTSITSFSKENHIYQQNLLPGEDPLRIELKPKKIEDMFRGGYQSLEKNIYYSGVVEIMKITSHGNTEKIESEKHTISRLVNSTDFDADDTLDFLDSAAAEGKSTQSITLELKQGSHDITWAHQDPDNEGLFSVFPLPGQPNLLNISQNPNRSHLSDTGDSKLVEDILSIVEVVSDLDGGTNEKNTNLKLESFVEPVQKLRLDLRSFTNAFAKILGPFDNSTPVNARDYIAMLGYKIAKRGTRWVYELIPEGQRNKINEIKLPSKSYYSDPNTITKIIERAKEIFADAGILVDISTGDEIDAVNATFKPTDIEWTKTKPREKVWSSVLGSSETVVGDTNIWHVLNMPNTYNNHMKLHELNSSINNDQGGVVNLYLANLLNEVVLNRGFRKLYRAFPEPETRYIEYMADTIVHEWGHAMGMPHPFVDIEGVPRTLFSRKWKNDPMSYDEHRTAYPPKFTREYSSFGKLASKVSVDNDDLRAALELINAAKSNMENKEETPVLKAKESQKFEFPVRDEPHEHHIEDISEPASPHYLFATSLEGEVLLASQKVIINRDENKEQTLQLKLTNYGSESIEDIRIVNGGEDKQLTIQVEEFNSLKPEQSIKVKIVFDKKIKESVSKLVTFETDQGYQYNLIAHIDVISTKPTVTLMEEIQNFGGLDFRIAQESSQVLNIKNTGSEVLDVKNISVDESDQFYLDPDTNTAMAINPGEIRQIKVWFKPDNNGLHHSTLRIESNDHRNKNIEIPLNGTGFTSSKDYKWGNDYIYLKTNEFINRQISDNQGIYELFAPKDEGYSFMIFDPESGLISSDQSDGKSINDYGPSVSFRPTVTGDSDGDGLSDEIEKIIGTSVKDKDTDKDGISDFDAIKLQNNPLGELISETGIIGNIQLNSRAIDFDISNFSSTQTQLIGVVATKSDELEIINYNEIMVPIKESAFKINDDLKAIEYLEGIQKVAVGGAKGIHIIDIRNLNNPILTETHRIIGGVIDLVQMGEYLVVATESSLLVVNQSSGSVLSENNSFKSISSIAVQGQNIFVVDNQRNLISLDYAGAELELLDSINLPEAKVRTIAKTKQISVINNIAYISNGLEIEQVPKFRKKERGGFITFDVADPSALALLSDIDTPPVFSGNLKTVTDGSGLILVAGGIADVELHNGTDPKTTYNLMASYKVNGNALSAQMAGSYGFISTSDNELVSLNLLGPDLKQIPPSVEFDWGQLDQDKNINGVQIEEGSLISIMPVVKDDHQIKEVNLYAENIIKATDNIPSFDFSINIPYLEFFPKETYDLAINATDTGNNQSSKISAEILITPDVTPPKIVNKTITDNMTILGGSRTFEIIFSEPIDNESFNRKALTIQQLNDKGAPIRKKSNLDFEFSEDSRSLIFKLDNVKEGRYLVKSKLDSIKDQVGNSFRNGFYAFNVRVIEPTSEWIGSNSNDWLLNDNWLEKRLPEPTDTVVINSASLREDAQIVLKEGEHNVYTMYLDGSIIFEKGIQSKGGDDEPTKLNLNSFEFFRGSFEQNKNTQISARSINMSDQSRYKFKSGVILNTQFNNQSAIHIASPQPCFFICTSNKKLLDSQLNAVIFDGPVEVRKDVLDENIGLTVLNGITINDELSLIANKQNFARFGFWGEQEIAGRGLITLSKDESTYDNFADNRLVLIAKDESQKEILKINPEITIRGTGFIGVNDTDMSNGHITIHGEIIADEGDIILEKVYNDDQSLKLNPLSGNIWLAQAIENTSIINGSFLENSEATSFSVNLGLPEDSPFGLSGEILVKAVDINSDLSTTESLDIQERFELNKDLSLIAGYSFRPMATLSNITSITGVGTIKLIPAGEDTQERFQGDKYEIRLADGNKELSEVFTFAEDIDIFGAGRISVDSLLRDTDYLRILGPITASNDTLEIESINNNNHPLTLSHVNGGTVILEDALKNAHIQNLDNTISKSNPVVLEGSVLLDNISLDVAAKSAAQEIEVFNSFAINSSLSLVPKNSFSSKLIINGTTSLQGDGEILLNIPEDPEVRTESRYTINFASVTDQSDLFIIPSGLAIRGTGVVKTDFGFSSNKDKIKLEGTLEAANGVMEVRSFDPISGTMIASRDSSFEISGDLEFTQSSMLKLDLDHPKDVSSEPKILSNDAIILDGEVNLDFSDIIEFTPGSEFLLATAMEGITGEFAQIKTNGLPEQQSISIDVVGNNLLAIIQ